MSHVVRAHLGLGANLGQPDRTLSHAMQVLGLLPDVTLVAQSALYRTPPLGPPGQPDYCNAAVALDTALPADVLLSRMLAVEHAFGRFRDGERWGARVLDLDLLTYGDQAIDLPGLTVPHPELAKRAFVLVPLAEIAPALTLPSGVALADLLAGVEDARSVVEWADA